MLSYSSTLDEVILQAIEKTQRPDLIFTVLAHRLGHHLGRYQDGEQLLDFLFTTMAEQVYLTRET